MMSLSDEFTTFKGVIKYRITKTTVNYDSVAR